MSPLSNARKSLLALLAFLVGGCAMSGNHHSAKIGDKGTSNFGINFGWNAYAPVDSATGRAINDSAWSVPIVLPEIAFSTVVGERFEIGGRASAQALGIEGQAKWGFYQGTKVFLALAPSLIGRALPYGEGISTLPLLATYKINDRFSLHGSGFVSHSEVADNNNKDYEEWVRKTFGASNTVGLSLGMEFTGETFIIRPMIEFSGVSPAEPDEVQWKPYSRTSVLLHLGWILGREKQQLDRMEKKLDALKK